MTRLARLVIPGWVHHFTQRGNNRQAVFYSDSERLVYLRLIREYFPLHGLTLVGYNMMTNHSIAPRKHHSRTPARNFSLARKLCDIRAPIYHDRQTREGTTATEGTVSHQWQANLRVLEVEEIKTVPYAPLSHPFVERLIGTIRREFLDRTLFWTTADLESKLLDFKHFYNGHRAHAGLDGRTPEPGIDGVRSPVSFRSYQWQKHCRGLYQTPIAA